MEIGPFGQYTVDYTSFTSGYLHLRIGINTNLKPFPSPKGCFWGTVLINVTRGMEIIGVYSKD